MWLSDHMKYVVRKYVIKLKIDTAKTLQGILCTIFKACYSTTSLILSMIDLLKLKNQQT
jgi:hypothetical protein